MILYIKETNINLYRNFQIFKIKNNRLDKIELILNKFISKIIMIQLKEKYKFIKILN